MHHYYPIEDNKMADRLGARTSVGKRKSRIKLELKNWERRHYLTSKTIYKVSGNQRLSWAWQLPILRDRKPPTSSKAWEYAHLCMATAECPRRSSYFPRTSLLSLYEGSMNAVDIADRIWDLGNFWLGMYFTLVSIFAFFNGVLKTQSFLF